MSSSLREALSREGDGNRIALCTAESTIDLSDFMSTSCLDGSLDNWRGRSVLLLTNSQLDAALALVELDGIARRIVLFPGDMPKTHVASVIAAGAVDTILSDPHDPEAESYGVQSCIHYDRTLQLPRLQAFAADIATEWVLLTSGTTGAPKLTVHTLKTLTAAIRPRLNDAEAVIWSTFYDIRRYGGLQIFLRALINGASLVLSSSTETTADFLSRAGAHGITHISGTPTHWRRALMSPQINRITPRYIRLSGEIADQGILDNLRTTFPDASIVHAFASTEAGVGFEVRDGLAGFPDEVCTNNSSGAEIKISDGRLLIRSPGNGTGYLGGDHLAVADGFVDTGDSVERHGDRYYFIGRRDGVINVGGAKVHPEEVEAVLNGHPRVRMSLVQGRKNMITGAIVVAEVVLESVQAESSDGDALRAELTAMCREILSPYKVPASIRFVPSLAMAASGKLARN